LREIGKGTLYMVSGGGLVQSVDESAAHRVAINSGPAAAPSGTRLGQMVEQIFPWTWAARATMSA
jgi:hypothetical protein